MRRRNGSGVPSQETVPHQDRYPVETAGNMMIDTNTVPIAQIHQDIEFPMPKPSPAGGSSVGYGSGSAFSTDSHTNGRKKE